MAVDGSVADVARLVIRAPNWLGDVVMALPAMATVRAGLPAASITVAAVPALAPLFEEATIARPDAVIAVPSPRAEMAALREGRFDAALLLPNSFRSAWSARRAGIRERWGVGANLRSLLLTRRVRRPRGRVHQARYYQALVEALGFGGDVDDRVGEDPPGSAAGWKPGAEPAIRVRPGTAARARRLLEAAGVAEDATLVGFAPGAAYGHAKRWPPRRVAEVVARLARERSVTAVLVGTATDRDAGREIESSLPADVTLVNLIGRTDLRALAGAVARCAAFVSNDSGAMHLAAALGVPVAAIFGPTDERVTSPLGEHDLLKHEVFCRPCMLRDCPIDHRCMKGVSPDTVFGAVARRLEARA
ncbi:MAG TPA: lipopolysaccharide heptosyltransferase II [Vicinamibacterales bacterium]|nr:lipopolysaccharide heptosyltransferase II [Vicinamibacterales bacterium]